MVEGTLEDSLNPEEKKTGTFNLKDYVKEYNIQNMIREWKVKFRIKDLYVILKPIRFLCSKVLKKDKIIQSIHLVQSIIHSKKISNVVCQLGERRGNKNRWLMVYTNGLDHKLSRSNNIIVQRIWPHRVR